ncbi:MAG: RNA methyltransferase [Bacteroidales bacterium]|jgi:tRNA G18 (ribose-2'-O)-methylase SpoU|nr:RNA methyltransferase [Bacteroidales bacterium]MDD4213185.1 RNA methyltransferase [Bacteroidales bacterium]
MRKIQNSELGRLSVEEFKFSEKFPIVVILDNVRSMNNIGSVFRTCDAFRVEKLMLCGITATPPHREIQKTALGATESVIWEYFQNTLNAINFLKEEGFVIIVVEQTNNSISLNRFNPEKTRKYALVFGNEINGVDEEIVKMSDACIDIPQFGTKHSFNIAVCAGIVLWEFVTKK